LRILIARKSGSNGTPSDYPYTTQSEERDSRRKGVGLISWILVGAIAGMVAKRIVPGPDPGRFIVTVLLGMAGASVGGFVVGVLGGSGTTGFNVWSVLVATLGAVLLLYVYGLIAREPRGGDAR
jgi:uncharacterized membrane protein YeaQ/YmgE (transglycosylase-associated protein family)